MGELTEDISLWHTPAVGAYLLWRFTTGYCVGHANGDAPLGLLHFIAAAILTNKELSKTISDKRESLQSYVRGFEDLEKSDRYLSLIGKYPCSWLASELGKTFLRTRGTVTMGELTEDISLWHTPAVGAYLLWRFTTGYCVGHANGDAPLGLLHFIAAAILTNKELSKTISDKRESLQSYVRGFEDLEKSDLLLSIQERVLTKRLYTLAAIDIAIAEGLLVWDVETGKLIPRNVKTRATRGKALKESFNRDGKKAEILGRWFAQHDLAAIAAYLRVVF